MKEEIVLSREFAFHLFQGCSRKHCCDHVAAQKENEWVTPSRAMDIFKRVRVGSNQYSLKLIIHDLIPVVHFKI